MHEFIPDYLAHMTASYCTPPNGTIPSQRYSMPVVGILVQFDSRRCVIGTAAKRGETDRLRIESVAGIGPTTTRYRNAISDSRGDFCDCSRICRACGLKGRRWTLLGTQVFDGERPGRMGKDGGFVLASPIRLPLASRSDIPSTKICPGAAFHTFGVRSVGTTTETLIVPVTLAQTMNPNIAFALPNQRFDYVSFEGAPILDATNRLVALALFADRCGSDKMVLVSVSWAGLISTYRWIIEGVC